MNDTNVLAAALGLLVKKFGTRCDMGFEIFIPSTVLSAIPPAGQIQHQVDPDGKGVFIRYYPNLTIEAEPSQPVETEVKPSLES